jgi:threonine/homoserine/homoserine lactone efflux protein
MGCGGLAFALAALLGLQAVLAVPALYLGLKVIGGMYLCYLGYRIFSGAKQARRGHGGPGAEARRFSAHGARPG